MQFARQIRRVLKQQRGDVNYEQAHIFGAFLSGWRVGLEDGQTPLVRFSYMNTTMPRMSIHPHFKSHNLTQKVTPLLF